VTICFRRISLISSHCNGIKENASRCRLSGQAIEMVSFSLARFLSISSVFLCFARVNSVAVNGTIFDGLDQQARDILARATPAAPHWVIYSDQFVSGTTGPPAVSAVTVRKVDRLRFFQLSPFATQGFNVFALSFLLTEGAFDKVDCVLSLIGLPLLVFQGLRMDDLDGRSKGICQSPIQCRRNQACRFCIWINRCAYFVWRESCHYGSVDS
jgi:hypothetical protein